MDDKSEKSECMICVACGMDLIFEHQRVTHEAICKRAHLLLGDIHTAICTSTIVNCKISATVTDAALGFFERIKPKQGHEETACEGRSPIESIEEEETVEGKVTIRLRGQLVSVIPMGRPCLSYSKYDLRTFHLFLERSHDMSTTSLTDLIQFMETSPSVGERILISLLESVMSLLQSHKAHSFHDDSEGKNELEDAKNRVFSLALRAVSQLCKSSKTCSLSLGAHRGRGYNELLGTLYRADNGDTSPRESAVSVSAEGINVLAGIFAFGPVSFFNMDEAMRLLPSIVTNYVTTAESAEEAFEVLVLIAETYNAEVEHDGGRTRDECPPSGDLHFYISALKLLNSNSFSSEDMKAKATSAIARIRPDLLEETRVVGRREKRKSAENCPDCEHLCPKCADIWFKSKES